MEKSEKINQEQLHSFIFNEKISWQDIIYDLINTEQLEPWDIDLSILSQKYLERVRELEETNFNLSSKVLLVASFMLRIKSELLMNRYIKDLDDILFNKKKEEQVKLEIPEFDEGEIPELLPRTPLPRFKKIGIQELMQALNKAIKTEERRDFKKQSEREAESRVKLFMPKKTISLKDKIKFIQEKVFSIFSTQDKVAFSEISGEKKEEKIDAFVPLLHLDNHNKLYLNQEWHFEEIWIHKDGKEFMKNDYEDEVITNKLEAQFEDKLDELS